MSVDGAALTVEGSTIRFDASTAGVLRIQPHQNDPGPPVNSWLVSAQATRGWFHPDGMILGPEPMLYFQHLAGAGAMTVTLTAVRADGSRAPSQEVRLVPR